MRTIYENLTIIENTNIAKNGKTAIVGTCDEISIQIISDSTSFEVKFEASLNNSDWVSIEGLPMNLQSEWATKTSAPNTVWSFDISTCEYFRVNLTSILNGSVKVIATSYKL